MIPASRLCLRTINKLQVHAEVCKFDDTVTVHLLRFCVSTCLHWLLSRSKHRYYYLAIDEVRPICGTADLDDKVYRVHKVLIRYLGAA